MIEFDIFESKDPKAPTYEDDFKMELTAYLGYGSVVDMLEKIDTWEYSFWLEKYKECNFGSAMQNIQLARIAYCVANAFGSSGEPFDTFIMKYREDNSNQLIIESTCRRYHANMKIWLLNKPEKAALEGQGYTPEQIERVNKGFTTSAQDREDLEQLAKVASEPYIRNYTKAQEALLNASD